MGGRRSRRAGSWLLDLGTRALVSGIAMLGFWLFLGSNPIAGPLAQTLMPLGVLLTFIGCLLLFMHRLPAGAPAEPVAPARQSSAARDAVIDYRSSNEARIEPLLDPPAADEAGQVRPTRWSAGVFDVIEWRRFEAVVERLFQQAGFETKSQSHGADGGIDIWLYSRHQPGEPVGIVQCKHWAGRVGVKPVRELRGVMASKNIARGQFATTSTFTDEASEFAQGNGINLLDADRLLELIALRTEAQQAELLAVALEGEYWRPTCASCGVKMVHRIPRSGSRPFWGCPNYGPRKCKAKIEMRNPSVTRGIS